CGQGGVACVGCSGSTSMCSSGTCVAPPQCSPSSCPSCGIAQSPCCHSNTCGCAYPFAGCN
ncbi:MAG: hypothetical protein ACREJ3_16545, partial [Polyangiaceae bacterium]